MYSNDDFRKEDLKGFKTEDGKDIFTLMGAADLPDNEKGELLAQMLEIIQNRVLLRIADSLTEEQQKEMEKAAESEGLEELENFISANVKNIEQLFTEETEKFKQEQIIKYSK